LEELVTPHRVRDEAPVSFLSRLAGDRPDREPSEEERFARELLAVSRNIGAVLNSRKGYGSVVSAFGLGDYEGSLDEEGTWEIHLGTRDILSVLLPELTEQLARFEPRLLAPKVKVLGRDGNLRAVFSIEGSLSGRPVRFRVALHTIYRDVVVEADAASAGDR
jgi:type VI secretion system protein